MTSHCFGTRLPTQLKKSIWVDGIFWKYFFFSITGDFVYITDRAYTESQIREMEMKILSSLEFNLGRPLPLNFLRRNSKAGNVDALVHTLAKYVMELTLGIYWNYSYLFTLYFVKMMIYLYFARQADIFDVKLALLIWRIFLNPSHCSINSTVCLHFI